MAQLSCSRPSQDAMATSSPMPPSWGCTVPLGPCSNLSPLPLPQGAAGKDGEAGAQGPPGPTVSISEPLATLGHWS